MKRNTNNSSSSNNHNNNNLVLFGILTATATAGLLWYLFLFNAPSKQVLWTDKTEEEDEEEEIAVEASTSTASLAAALRSVAASSPSAKEGVSPAPIESTRKPTSTTTTTDATATTSTPTPTSKEDDETAKKEAQEALNKKVEAADKRGKSFFKSKNYLQAAECFTEAIDLLQSPDPDSPPSKSKQALVTLLNNRSAMYEKAKLEELALVDCEAVLDLDVAHEKARMRKMRVLEGLHRWKDALVEVCALQLRFMQLNRDKLKMGIPVTPPVSQDKIEEIMSKLLPTQVESTLQQVKDLPRRLPSRYTVQQLLKSFSGYHGWMAKAAKLEAVGGWTEKLKSFENVGVVVEDKDGDEKNEEEERKQRLAKAKLLLQRGRRGMYDGTYPQAAKDFEEAFQLVGEFGEEFTKEDSDGEENLYARLLEWTGMCRHLRYDLEGALKCYEKCSDLEPTNAEILVKRAGVNMDAGKLETSLQLFETALGLEPDAVDALLHRSNLRMLQQRGQEAKEDLQRCLELRPSFVLAHLRLATLYMAEQDLENAKKSLDAAEKADPESSEVHSYRGEMYFAQGDYETAKKEFDLAMECEPGNPTPYVNKALAVMNTPSSFMGGLPDVKAASELFSKAIEVDPMFHAAYVHLGQLRLSMATSLVAAQEVVELYDKGMEQCRTAEELKDICSMRILTVAQVEAARALKMETLNMQ